LRDRVPAATAERGGRLFGDDPAPPPQPADVPAHVEVLLLAHGIGREALMLALMRETAASFFVEVTAGEDMLGDWLGLPAVDNGFTISLTTSTAFSAQCAVAVSTALIDRGVLDADRRASFELCIHEAIANAVIHGNLGIASAAKDEPDGFRSFTRMINERLADETIRSRRIEIFVRWGREGLDIAVLDQGPGFDPLCLPGLADNQSRSGRGFAFMATLADGVSVSDGGRCTVLHFNV
jgi:anti-sigma regulatory factor (Ser/Thr protein kinase)